MSSLSSFLKRWAWPFLVIVAVFSPAAAYGQAVRAMYYFTAKTSPDDSLASHQPAMCLDYDGKRSVYYSEPVFYRDSLANLAFDKNGNIRNQKEYNKIHDYPGWTAKDAVFIDYAKKTFSVSYHEAQAYINSTETGLQLPQWTLTEETDTTKEGFHVKKAFAEYMGRKWTAW